MTAKKKWFKRRNGYAIETPQDGGFYCNEYKDDLPCEQRVRITDARELTPEKAVERVLSRFLDFGGKNISTVQNQFESMAQHADMTATVRNGKVRVRMNKP